MESCRPARRQRRNGSAADVAESPTLCEKSQAGRRQVEKLRLRHTVPVSAIVGPDGR